VRAGFRALISVEEDISVVGEAEDGAAAIDVVTRVAPDVVLMDLRMPRIDGVEATRRIASDARLAATKVVMLTTFETDDNLFAALRAGASGFVVKDAGAAELLRAIRVVAQGDSLLSPSVTRRLVAEFARRPHEDRPHPDLADLTEREREVLTLVGAGLSNDEIAERLVLSPATAKTHVSRIMGKLAARDRAQLVVMAYESGLVVPSRLGR
jgi:DNA-binding NarL/FixJ family response regulator